MILSSLYFVTSAFLVSSLASFSSGCTSYPFHVLKSEVVEGGQVHTLSQWEKEVLSYGNNWEHDEGTSHASDLESLLKVIEYSRRSDYQVPLLSSHFVLSLSFHQNFVAHQLHRCC